MSTATALLLSGLCVGICATAQESSAPAIACNLKAIAGAERSRYKELVKRLRTAIRRRTEIADGYIFQLDSRTVTLPEAAEWISLERLCCPFLTLQLSVSGNRQYWLLTLTGPEGVKPLLNAEFPTR